MKKTLIIAAVPALLTGCLDRIDYHGIDPKAYNEVLYPKINKVEYNSVYHSFYFKEGGVTFDQATLNEIDKFINRAHPNAVSNMRLIFGNADAERELYVTRLLRARGFKKSIMDYGIDESMHPDEIVMEMDYSFVVLPDCPDWRKSSNINYSNTKYSNGRCAVTVNFGSQIADPSDIDGSAVTYITPDAPLNTTAIENYRSGAVNEATDGAIETNNGN